MELDIYCGGVFYGIFSILACFPKYVLIYPIVTRNFEGDEKREKICL
jgi:hypothetical protein